MAPRKNTKNPSQAITEALDTPLEATVFDAAMGMGLTSGELRERLAAKLDNDDPLDWETIPTQHEPLIEQIARDLESEASVRRLTPPQEEPPQLPAQPEPPVLEEEVKPAGKITRSKRQPSQLTDKRKQSIDKTSKTSKKLGAGLDEAELLVEAQKGRKKAAKKAAVKLLAEEETYNEILTKAAIQRLADAVGETEEEEEFDPLAYVRQGGSQDLDETLKTALEKISPVLGKLQEASDEIVDNSYSNGGTLDLSHLEKLMRSTN